MSYSRFRRVFVVALAACSFSHFANAEVGVRVDGRPRSAPIEAYVLPTDTNGAISGLVAEDFVVTLDGAPIGPFELTLPPRQDPTQKTSIVIIARRPLPAPSPVVNVEVYEALIRQLVPGDFVAVVILGSDELPWGEWIGEVSTLPFRRIDGGVHTEQIVKFLNNGQSGLANITRPYALVEATGMSKALEQFEFHAGRLPIGTRSIVTWEVSPFYEEIDPNWFVQPANRYGVSIFTRHRVGSSVVPEVYTAQQALTDATGGVLVEVPPNSGSAMPVVASWLKDGYRLTIPAAAVNDCGLHMLEVTVRGETANAPFARCDVISEQIEFPYQGDVESGSTVVSAARRVRGLGSPTQVFIPEGEYSIGCGETFTSESNYIQPGQTICVRHTAASLPGEYSSTSLFIGGVWSFFASRVAQ